MPERFVDSVSARYAAFDASAEQAECSSRLRLNFGRVLCEIAELFCIEQDFIDAGRRRFIVDRLVNGGARFGGLSLSLADSKGAENQTDPAPRYFSVHWLHWTTGTNQVQGDSSGGECPFVSLQCRKSGPVCNLGNTFHVYFSINPVFNRRALVFSLAIASAAARAGWAGPADDEPVFDIVPGIKPPRVTHQVTPVNKPDDDRGFRISGTVLVGLVVSSQGEPKDVHVVKSLDKDIDQSAIDAVKQWRFDPAKKGDQPVAVGYYRDPFSQHVRT